MDRWPVRPGLAGAVGLALLGAWLLSGCGHPSGSPVENQPPAVSITGGPMDGTEAAYTARIYWTGWDNDGVVDGYEYAIDPPGEFTLEEIAHPERFPDLSIRRILGATAGLDTLLVTKRAEGPPPSFRWVQTRDFSRAFEFSTPHPDSTIEGSTVVPAKTFSGSHAVFVRARDDDGDYSDAARLAYSAMSVVPSSEIRHPIVTASVLTTGTTIKIRWDGTDPDATSLKLKPAGYLYRMLDLDSLDPSPSLLHVQPNVMLAHAGRESLWTYMDAETSSVTFQLNNRGRYIFAVRAVDEAGAVEPFLDLGRNVFRFQSLSSAGFPKLHIEEATAGVFDFRGTTGVLEAEAPAGAPLRFSWTASAEDYGGVVEGFSYGFDLVDLEREGPSSGWSGWGKLTSISPPPVFREPGIHTLYVRVRDTGGAITLGALTLKILDFSMDREVLLIDDSADRSVNPTDSQHDAFWASLFEDSERFGAEPLHTHSTYGAGDTFSFTPAPVLMSVMARYRTLLWTINGSSSNGDTSLLRATSTTNHLAWYLRAGGTLWVTGCYTLPSTTPPFRLSSWTYGADFYYPKAPAPGSFAHDFLKLRSSRFMNDKGSTPANWMTAAVPFPGKQSGYPLLAMDQAKVGPYKVGILAVDAAFDPIYCQDNDACDGIIDSLYVYKASSTKSLYNDKLIATRWHDPNPYREHGRIQWFGFPLYYMKKEQAQDVFNRSIDWFREEQRLGPDEVPAPPSR
jgi:hypothetical protein